MYLRPTIILLGSNLAFSQKEDPERCAKVCDKSWFILIRLLDCMSLAHRIFSGQAKIICVSTESEPHGQKWRMYNKKRKSKNSFNITCSKNRLCISLSLSTEGP